MKYEFIDNFSTEKLIAIYPKANLKNIEVAGEKALALDYGLHDYDLHELLETIRVNAVSDVLVRISLSKNAETKIKKVITKIYYQTFHIKKNCPSVKFHLLYKKKFSWIINDLPTKLAVEPTNVCDLDCIGCREQASSPGFMKLEDFKRIVSQFKNIQIISLFGFGESLLHPDILEFIDISKDVGAEEVRISTHFSMENDRLIKDLANSKLDKLVIGLDGATKESYQKFRRGGNFNRVISNIQKIKEYHPHCKLVIQFIPNRYNEHEVHKARALAKKLGVDYFSIRILSTIHDEILPQSPLYRHQVKCRTPEDVELLELTEKQLICFIAMNSFYINQDGSVFPCTYLWGFNKLIPEGSKRLLLKGFPYNILKQSAEEIWLDEEYFKFRYGFLNGYPIKLCRACVTEKLEMPQGKEIAVK